MSSLSQFVGAGATTGLVNVPDSWAVEQNGSLAGLIGTGIAFGATTANVYKTLLTINGQGFLDWLHYISNATTSRVVKVRITIDGTVVQTSTSGTITAASNYGKTLVGASAANEMPIGMGGLRFNSQLLVEVQDNVGGTIDQSIRYIARTE